MWTYAGQTRSGTWYPSGVLYTEIVVDGMIEFLLTAQVALRRLDRCVAEQELYLLQFSTRQMAQPGACTALMPHAALSSLCRMPDHAESIDRSSQGQFSGRW